MPDCSNARMAHQSVSTSGQSGWAGLGFKAGIDYEAKMLKYISARKRLFQSRRNHFEILAPALIFA
jgi:hypothetical protein